jgi:DNA-directed RNA polymerase subunit A'
MSYSGISRVIDKIKFGLLSPNEIRKMSATRIITADTYDDDGLPLAAGLMDQKLGTIEPGQKCTTCGNRVGQCLGHFGHIELARPVVHVGYAKLLLKLLRSICPSCSRLLLTEDQFEDFKKRKEQQVRVFENVSNVLVQNIFKTARKAKTCPFCGEERKKIPTTPKMMF